MYTPQTILVVEDDVNVRTLVASSLRFAGFNTIDAANVQAALAVVRLSAHELSGIVSDVDMPGLSVTMLIDAARAQRPPIPVLLMSGHIHDRKVAELIGRGDVPLLEKPFSWDELIRSVRRVIGG